jgi:hypothetical protein
MTSKTLMTVAALAVAVVMSGCTTAPPYPVDAGGKTQVDCRTKKDCPVDLAHDYWHTGYPDEVLVNVPPGGKVTITWTIKVKHSNDDTTFAQDGGINLKDDAGKAAFNCMQDSVQKNVYTCHNVRDLAPNGEYRYGIRTKGFWSGLDIDPVIRNGAS